MSPRRLAFAGFARAPRRPGALRRLFASRPLLASTPGTFSLLLCRYVTLFVGLSTFVYLSVNPFVAMKLMTEDLAAAFWWVTFPVVVATMFAGVAALAAMVEEKRQERRASDYWCVQGSHVKWDRIWRATLMIAMIEYAAVMLTICVYSVYFGETTSSYVKFIELNSSYHFILGIATPCVLSRPFCFAYAAVLSPTMVLTLPGYESSSVQAFFEGTSVNISFTAASQAMVCWLLGQGRELDRATAESRRQYVNAAASQARMRARLKSNSFVHDNILSLLAPVANGIGQSKQLRAEARAALEGLCSALTDDGCPRSASALFARLQRWIDSARAPIELRIFVHEDVSLPPEVSQAIYDAALEAIKNSLLHAANGETEGAVSRVVELTAVNRSIYVSVADDGRGFDPGALPEGRFGVANSIVARMQEVHGRARIASSPGEGSLVSISWNPHETKHETGNSAVNRRYSRRAAAREEYQAIAVGSLASAPETGAARINGAIILVAHLYIAISRVKSGSYSHDAPVMVAYCTIAVAFFLVLRSWKDSWIPTWSAISVVVLSGMSNFMALMCITGTGWPGIASWSIGISNVTCLGLMLRYRLTLAWVGVFSVFLSTAVWSLLDDRPLIVLLLLVLPPVAEAAIWYIMFRRSMTTSTMLVRTQEATTEFLSRRSADEEANRAIDQVMTSVSERARPILTELANGAPITPALRLRARLLEAELRDEIRARFFTGTDVVEAARAARIRGTEVILLDDGKADDEAQATRAEAVSTSAPERASHSAPMGKTTPIGKTSSVRENIIENVTQILERDRSERLVVRVLPPGRSMSVSIVGDDGSSFLDAEGNLLDAEGNLLDAESDVVLESKQ